MNRASSNSIISTSSHSTDLEYTISFLSLVINSIAPTVYDSMNLYSFPLSTNLQLGKIKTPSISNSPFFRLLIT